MCICKLCEYVASFRKGGLSEPNELPLNPPLQTDRQWNLSMPARYTERVCGADIGRNIVPSHLVHIGQLCMEESVLGSTLVLVLQEDYTLSTKRKMKHSH